MKKMFRNIASLLIMFNSTYYVHTMNQWIEVTAAERNNIIQQLQTIVAENVNIPEGSGWNNHYCCGVGKHIGKPFLNLKNLNQSHKNELKLLVYIKHNASEEQVILACKEKMISMIKTIANTNVIHFITITKRSNGEYRIESNNTKHKLPFYCYNPTTEKITTEASLFVTLSSDGKRITHVYIG